VDEKTRPVRAARRGTWIVVGTLATWAAAAVGIALATRIFGDANEPEPVPVAIAAPIAASPSVGAAPAHEATAQPADDAGIDDKPTRRAIRHAVQAFCESSARMARGYYDEKPRITKARACRDIRDQLRHLCRVDRRIDTFEETAALPFVFDDERDFLTYWEVSLRRDGASWSVTSIDFEEDCTGP
jgi:hypothetical protein